MIVSTKQGTRAFLKKNKKNYGDRFAHHRAILGLAGPRGQPTGPSGTLAAGMFSFDGQYNTPRQRR